VPPIYQPEVAARAIRYAAHHDRREMYVGMPTVEAIVGNKVAPGLLDHYLARTGYESQQTDEPADPNRPNNPGSLCRAITARMASSTTGRAITVCNCGPTLIAGCWRWWDSGWLERPMRCFRETGDEVIANNALASIR